MLLVGTGIYEGHESLEHLLCAGLSACTVSILEHAIL